MCNEVNIKCLRANHPALQFIQMIYEEARRPLKDRTSKKHTFDTIDSLFKDVKLEWE